jgi:serine/threonine-protein kinase
MAKLDANHHLLFGLLALQNGLIDQDQLIAAFRAWTRDKDRPLAEHLVALGHVNAAGRAAIEALASLHVEKHGGAEKSLAALPAGRSTQESLARLGDADVEASVALLGAAITHLGEDADRTATYSVGSATSDGQRFRVLRPHASGGLGAVFVALDSELHREVALKQILDKHADDPVSRQRFLLEAEVTGGLEHPGIVPVYGLGTYGDGRPYYAMRFIRGDSLKEAIERFHADAALKTDAGRRSLELRQLLRRFLDVCNAIEYAHSRGVLHRDIKPGNIIVGKHGETLVVDWGLAKATGRSDPSSGERTLNPSSASGSAETLPGSAMGTPGYMSPEQARGDLEHLGPLSDVYSLGATLYCLLTGRPPFEGDVGDVLRAVQKGDARPPRTLDPALDRALEAVCLKAMALREADRYATPRALSEDVERWLADEPVTAYREPLTTRLTRWGRRHKTAAVGIGALLLTAIAGLSIGTVLINRERARAEESFRQARKAVDDYFTTVSESKLLDVPGLQPLRKELLERALNYYQGFIRQRGADRSVRAELAATCYRAARITEMIGASRDAMPAYRQALAIYELLSRDHPEVARFRSDLAIACNDLGNLLDNLGQPEEALRIQEKGLAIRQDVARTNPCGARYQNELSKSYANIASLLANRGRHAEALQSYRKACEIDEQALAARPARLEFATDLGKAFNTLATIQADLAIDHEAIGYILARMNQPSESVRSYQEAVAIMEQVVAENPEVDEYQRLLASMEVGLAFRRRLAGEFDEAFRLYQKSRGLLERLVERNPSVIGFRSDLAWCYTDMGSMLTEDRRAREALPWLRKAGEIIRRLAVEQPSVAGFQRLLAANCLHLGRMPADVMPTSDALDNLRGAEGILMAFPDPTPGDRYNLACARALIFPLIGRGQRELTAAQQAERSGYEASAMKTLREAIAAGFHDIENMSTDGDLEALRARGDFQELLRGLKDRARAVSR